MVLGGMLVYPASMARDVVRFYRDFMPDAPDALGTGLVFMTAPPLDAADATHREPVVGVVCCYTGAVAEGYEVLGPLRSFGSPMLDLVQPMTYVALQQLNDDRNPPGRPNYWSGDFLAELPDEAIDRLVQRATAPVSTHSQVLLTYAGGAVARMPAESTAFADRRTPWAIHYLSMWDDPADTDLNIAYTKTIAAAMRPWTTGRVYLNTIGDEGHARIVSAFGAEKYARLAALKKTWDPSNVFHHNQNIQPAD